MTEGVKVKFASGISRKAIGKRILLSWLAVWIFGVACGCVVAYLVNVSG